MSELWKPPRRDESDGPGVARMDRQELHATLADLARSAEPETQPAGPDVAGPGAAGPGGPTGRQTLAALAARAARSADGSASPGADPSPSPATEIAPAALPLPTRSILSGGVPQPVGGASSPPAVAVPPDGAPNGKPAALSFTGRLPGQKPAPVVPAALEQPTIAMRRRPVVAGPASVSSITTDPPTEAAPAPAPATRVLMDVAAWTPRDDDILPPRQMRRRRAWRLSR
jgi:hypothetical protein